MIAVDTNILVYSHRTEVTWHNAALSCDRSLAEGSAKWAVPWPSIHEFVAVVTNRRFHALPTPLQLAFEQIKYWMDAGNLVLLHEGPNHLSFLERLSGQADLTGAKIHDARIAAICLQHGVSELWTAYRYFSVFRDLKTRNPMLYLPRAGAFAPALDSANGVHFAAPPKAAGPIRLWPAKTGQTRTGIQA